MIRYLFAAALALICSTAATAQIQPGPNLGRFGMFTYAPRAGYLGPPVPFVRVQPPGPGWPDLMPAPPEFWFWQRELRQNSVAPWYRWPGGRPPPPPRVRPDVLDDVEPNPRGITRQEVENALVTFCRDRPNEELCRKLTVK
jgi:hypothetical protein